tara:strand:+ start:3334 stop:5556 length:2223 start_codon:yes stop_codon:yes gene_type:complete
MATPQLSPGVLTREVDLTVGRADNVLDNIGAIAGPFPQGAVEEVVDITTEAELIKYFGKPLSTDAQYEYWMTASSFLSYGGVLKVVRANDADLKSANAGVGIASTSINIKSKDDYEINFEDDSVQFYTAARNPGSWADSLKVCQIDDFADQRLFFNTTDLSGIGMTVGFAVTANILSGTALIGVGTTASTNAILKGVIVGVNTNSTDGSKSSVDVRVTERILAVGGGTTFEQISYAENDPTRAFTLSGANSEVTINVTNTSGTAVAIQTASIIQDWYDEQTLGLTNSVLYWKTLAPKPVTNSFVSDRDGKNDGIHIAVVDDLGEVTGITGNILETHLNLSKASDAVRDQAAIYFKDYIRDRSEYIFYGRNQSSAYQAEVGGVPQIYPTHSGFTTTGTYTGVSLADGLWGQPAQDRTFSVVGNKTFTLEGGVDYSSAGGATATLGDLTTAYELFNDKESVEVDYLLMGPGLSKKSETQAKANYLIGIANQRKDCMAVISPHRSDVVNITNTNTQTENVIAFYGPLSSSSYAVFDSGYKYTYDRFNNKFRYIPCNGDVAGLMVRTAINAYPWFSPAGQQRGILNNAIKLAYNPTKAQRDRLYPKRINAIINEPGVGILLFGDKTALGFQSAFDRINVRRLFLTIEQALQQAAKAQLFELNDDLTRANFVNIVAPYLRDVQAKRGLFDFLVVCDETNNTPDVIDNNEFRADIYLKPAKSINYVTLTFVATRTGVSFDEVAGRV